MQGLFKSYCTSIGYEPIRMFREAYSDLTLFQALRKSIGEAQTFRQIAMMKMLLPTVLREVLRLESVTRDMNSRETNMELIR